MLKSTWGRKTKQVIGGGFAAIIAILVIAGIYAPPTVEVATLNSSQPVVVESDSYQISGKIYPVKAGLVVNGQAVQTNDKGEFTATVPLQEGDNTISVTATDGDKVTKEDYPIQRVSISELADRERKKQEVAALERADQERNSKEASAQQASEQIKQDRQNKRNHWHKILSIVDGDTVSALVDGSPQEVRLLGVDAPEVTGAQQCYGTQATAKTNEFLSGKWIQLEADYSQERDANGRLQAYIWFDNGTDLGKRLIEEGYAYARADTASYAKQKQYTETQTYSKNKIHGLWAPTACNGTRNMPKPVVAAPAPAPSPKPTPPPAPAPKPAPAPSSGVVKKSNSDICHAPGTTYYNQTKNFTSYPSLEACLNSGGRMPKR